MNVKRTLVAAFVASALLAPAAARAAVYPITGDTADYEAQDVGAVSNGASGYLRAGTRTIDASSGGATVVSAIFPFALPALSPGETITAASVRFSTTSQTTRLPLANADLYGLPFHPAPMASDAANYYSGPNDTTPGVTKLQDDFLTPSDVSATDSLPHDSTDIASYIQSLYDAGAAPGDFALIRVSYDAQPVDTTDYNRYQIWSAGTTSSDLHPTLTITTSSVPEPASLSLLAIGALPLLRRRSR